MVLLYLSLFAVRALADCQDDILLTPEMMFADGGTLDNLADGRYDTYWQGASYPVEHVYFHFSSEVQVKWIFIQR